MVIIKYREVASSGGTAPRSPCTATRSAIEPPAAARSVLLHGIAGTSATSRSAQLGERHAVVARDLLGRGLTRSRGRTSVRTRAPSATCSMCSARSGPRSSALVGGGVAMQLAYQSPSAASAWGCRLPAAASARNAASSCGGSVTGRRWSAAVALQPQIVRRGGRGGTASSARGCARVPTGRIWRSLCPCRSPTPAKRSFTRSGLSWTSEGGVGERRDQSLLAAELPTMIISEHDPLIQSLTRTRRTNVSGRTGSRSSMPAHSLTAATRGALSRCSSTSSSRLRRPGR